MKKLISYKLSNGDEIIVEAEEKQYESEEEFSAGESMLKAKTKFEEAINNLKPISENIIKKIKSLSVSPDEAVVEFGLKFNSKAGVILASSSVEANINLKFKWLKNLDQNNGNSKQNI